MARLVDRAAVAGGALALSFVALLVILWHYRPEASSTRNPFAAVLLGAAAGWAVGASTVRFLYLADPSFAEYAGKRGAEGWNPGAEGWKPGA